MADGGGQYRRRVQHRLAQMYSAALWVLATLHSGYGRFDVGGNGSWRLGFACGRLLALEIFQVVGWKRNTRLVRRGLDLDILAYKQAERQRCFGHSFYALTQPQIVVCVEISCNILLAT